MSGDGTEDDKELRKVLEGEEPLDLTELRKQGRCVPIYGDLGGTGASQKIRRPRVEVVPVYGAPIRPGGITITPVYSAPIGDGGGIDIVPVYTAPIIEEEDDDCVPVYGGPVFEEEEDGCIPVYGALGEEDDDDELLSVSEWTLRKLEEKHGNVVKEDRCRRVRTKMYKAFVSFGK